MDKKQLIEELENICGAIDGVSIDLDQSSLTDESAIDEAAQFLTDADNYIRRAIEVIESIEPVYTIFADGEIVEGEDNRGGVKICVSQEVLEIIARDSDRLTFGMHKAVSHLRKENKMLKQFIDDNATEKVEA